VRTSSWDFGAEWWSPVRPSSDLHIPWWSGYRFNYISLRLGKCRYAQNGYFIPNRSYKSCHPSSRVSRCQMWDVLWNRVPRKFQRCVQLVDSSNIHNPQQALRFIASANLSLLFFVGVKHRYDGIWLRLTEKERGCRCWWGRSQPSWLIRCHFTDIRNHRAW